MRKVTARMVGAGPRILCMLFATLHTVSCDSQLAAESDLAVELSRHFREDGLAIMTATNKHWTAYVFGQDRYIEHDVPMFLYADRITDDGAAIVGQSFDKTEMLLLTIDGKVAGTCQVPISASNITLAPSRKKALVIGRRYIPGRKGQTVDRGLFYISGLWGNESGCQPRIERLAVTILSNGPDANFGWSLDEKAFTYEDDGHILIYDILNAVSKPIAEGHSPRWSPDGKWISFRGPRGEATLISPITGERREIRTGRPIRGALHWSPDSRFLFFSELAPIGEAASAHFVVYRLSDGSALTAFKTWSPVTDFVYDWAYVPEDLRR